MVWLKKAQGGAAIGQYAWPEDNSVTEVPNWLAQQLLAIPGNDFTQVDGPAEPAPAPGKPSTETPAVSSTRGRGKTVVKE